MKHLYDSLRGCAKEEEVKADFCKFLKKKVFALRGIDHYTERVPPAEALRLARDALRAKLLPQIYSLGFLNPDVEYFS